MIKHESQDISLQTLLRECGDTIIYLDPEYRVIFLNGVAETILGISLSRMQHKNLFVICKQYGVTFSFNDISLELAIHQETSFTEGFISYADKPQRSMLWKHVLFTEGKGINPKILIIGKDISELVACKNNISIDSFYLKSIIENLPEYIYWKDKNFVYQGCNRNVAEFLGLESPDDIIGKVDEDFGAYWSEERIKQLRQIDNEILSNGLYSIVEDIIPKPDGSSRFMLTSKRPLLNKNGEVIGIVGVSADITEHRRAEVLEVEKLKAEHDRLVAEEYAGYMEIVAGAIAHEIRTPLASIRGAMTGMKRYLPLLFEGYQLAKKADLPVKNIRTSNYQTLESVTDSVDRELAYTNNVIDMLLMNIKYHDKLINDQTLTVISINKIIWEALQRYPFKSEEQKRLVRWQNPQRDFLFLGTEILMVHVLFNLLKNAFYYIEAERKGEIYIWVESGKEKNLLHFKDTARGMSEEMKKSLFKRFHSTRIGGTGIGLAFCKVVMESLNGALICHSVEGQYTEFVLEFPKTIG